MGRPPRRLWARMAPAVLVALALAACSDSSGPATPGPGPVAETGAPTSVGGGRTTDRLAVVTEMVETVVAPLLRAADEAVSAAHDAAEAYCARPGPATLDDARAAIDAGIAAYERLDPVDMGPITLNRTDSQVGYPVDPARVDEIVADGPPVDALTVNEMLPASTRGLPAAEHLLAGAVPSAAEPGTCAFLVAVTTNAAAEMAAVITDSFEGSRGNPPYLNVLTGDANVAEEPQDTINVVVNMMMNVLDEDAGMLADPQEGPPSSLRRATLAHLATVTELWGDGTSGLSRLVEEDLAERVAAEIATTTAVVEDDTGSSADAQIAVDGLRATIGTEVVAALDVVVGFSDNDGDS